jgi:hypothetical protein
MSPIPNHVIDQILVPSLLRFLFIGGLFSLVVGIGLVVHSKLMFRVFGKMNRWISLRRSTRALEIPRDCWPLVQRYRYILAVFITVGAIYTLFRLLTQVDVEAVVPGISTKLHLPGSYVSWILSSIRWFLMLGCVLSIVVGLLLGFSLPTLSKWEALSGTWISTRNSAFGKKAGAVHVGFDELVQSYPKTAGWVVVILSMVELALVWVLLS